jgi:CCR4-NOT transcription complex subunit 9
MAGSVYSPKPVPYMQQQRYADIPDGYGRHSAFSAGGGSAAGGGGGHQAYLPGVNAGGYQAAHEEDKIYALVIELMDGPLREQALLELSKKREQYDELALVLWHSFGADNCSSAMGRPC